VKRWLVTIYYRSRLNFGFSVTEHAIEELQELESIVEHGPDWNCISSISISLARNSPIKYLEDA
jgi:hypothetical protein